MSNEEGCREHPFFCVMLSGCETSSNFFESRHPEPVGEGSSEVVRVLWAFFC